MVESDFPSFLQLKSISALEAHCGKDNDKTRKENNKLAVVVSLTLDRNQAGEVVTEVGKFKGVGTFKFEKISIDEGFLLVIKFFYSYDTLSM